MKAGLFRITKRLFSQQIGVVGSGQMGTGIAYVFSRQASRNVVVYDTNKNQLNKSSQFIDKLIEKEVAKKTLDNTQAVDVKKRFVFSDDINSLKETGFVIEAAIENFDVKAKIFENLDKITDKNTILATNTSSISITKLAGTISRPDKIIGMHFMNPVPVMKLVEVIKGLATSEQTLNTTLSLIKEVKKEVAISNDVPGFVVNRILMPMINEAVFTLYEGIATKEDIDKSMLLGTNMPMGPLVLADFIGLDTCLAILNVLHSELKDPKYRPCILLVNYVNAGRLGRKTGKGFYDYTSK